MNDQLKQKFGTGPVFFTAISTILGAIMFLRFGFAVGSVGFVGTLAIIFIGHAVTIPTAMAIAEIATNQKVEGGGEYYIISRSFGLVIGSTIGLALYLSQAISVAFYIMAFTEAFSTGIDWLITSFQIPAWGVWLLEQKQLISVPALLILTMIVLTKGADLGVKALYVVVATLAISMIAFFAGTTDYEANNRFDPLATVYNTTTNDDTTVIALPPPVTEDSTSMFKEVPVIRNQTTPAAPNTPGLSLGFFTVFAIIFPAFTGMTAGVGLSGDLRDPGRSIPLGTLAATIGGMFVYFLIAYKLAVSASPEDLADTSKLVMADIAIQGWWLIPVGLAAATISSALGSIMVAPRTLQAIARDKIFPTPALNRWISVGKGKNDEPYNASVITVVIALIFISMGAIDSVAEVISMFFMVTYGSLCLISFLNHFAADPSYRPKFRSKWFISLFGAIACFGLMFFMNTTYALLAVVFIIGLYFLISSFNPDKRSIAVIFQGVIFQLSRRLQVFLQKADKEKGSWRPSAVALTSDSFQRLGAFDMLRWIAQKYGFGTYIHQIKGYLSRQTNQEAKDIKERLIRMGEASSSNIYVDTLISPSYTSSVAQVIQLPGIAGTENNLLLLEFSKHAPIDLEDIVDNFKLIRSVDFDVAILASSERGFGLKKDIHIWLTSKDFDNANLMILLAYVLLGHKDWGEAEIKIFALYPQDTCEVERQHLYQLIEAGQLPISTQNIQIIARNPNLDTISIVNEKSRDADLTILGFREEAVKHDGKDVFMGYSNIGNILFVNAVEQKEIK
ncbi:amino acid permease [Lewinella cohaerens]|uniref:amino acid permease n=1 Tax=Lewinella cohaerens TaxID=70995 RepID=UPI00036F943E|nr:amino acid permease [Lewinella cohaerens]